MANKSKSLYKRILPMGIIALLTFTCSGFSEHGSSPYTVNSTLNMLSGMDLHCTRKMLCGPVCLYFGIRCLGIEDVSLDDIALLSDGDITSGTTMFGLKNACKKMGLHAEGMQLGVRELTSYLKSGVLGIIEADEHFLLITKIKDNKFCYISNKLKPTWIEMEKLEEGWDGRVLLISTKSIRTGNKSMTVLMCGGVLGMTSLIAFVVFGKRRKT